MYYGMYYLLLCIMYYVFHVYVLCITYFLFVMCYVLCTTVCIMDYGLWIMYCVFFVLCITCTTVCIMYYVEHQSELLVPKYRSCNCASSKPPMHFIFSKRCYSYSYSPRGANIQHLCDQKRVVTAIWTISPLCVYISCEKVELCDE